jgi:phosphopantothenate---cysteine ligase (CTP)
VEVKSGKFSTRDGPLLAELMPTPKLIASLRGWFPKADVVGWKYVVDGTRVDGLAQGREQLEQCATDACVVNGPAYGDGFGLVARGGGDTHIEDRMELYAALANLLAGPAPAAEA